LQPRAVLIREAWSTALADSQFRDEWLATTIEALVGPDKLDELRASEDASGSLWETAVAHEATTDEALVSALATRIGLKLADLSDSDPGGVEIIPEDVARRYHIFPLHATDSFLEIATANPLDLDCEKMLAFATGREIRMLLASPSSIQQKLDESYHQGGVIDRLLEGMGSEAEVTELEAAQDEADVLAISAEEASQRPVVRLVDLILSEAVLSRASDIHVEPEEGGVAVRYRIDGVLRQVMKMPRAAGFPMISRLKIMASLDIADRLRPQDGRARVGVNGLPVDLRVSTLPAALGEKHSALPPNGTAPGRAWAQGGRNHEHSKIPRTPPWDRAGHGAHGIRENHHALLSDQLHPERGAQHRHGRGSGGVSDEGHRPGPGARAGRADVRIRPPLDPATGPRRGAGW
jgi:hypothetical protein